MKTPIDKQLKSLLEKLDEQGWRRKDTKSGWIYYPPDPNLPGVAIHKTPSDHRWYANTITRLKRSGFIE